MIIGYLVQIEDSFDLRDKTFDIHEEDNVYYYKYRETGEIIPTTLTDLRNMISSYSGKDSIKNIKGNDGEKFYVKKIIPICDKSTIVLKSESYDSLADAEKMVNEKFDFFTKHEMQHSIGEDR